MAEVTVVIPTVDRVALLDRCLGGLARPQAVDFDAIVVHDGDPGVVAVIERWARCLPLRGLRVDERGAAAKRNAGWRAATAPVVAFTDDDCQPTAGWLAAGLAALGPDIDLVQGRIEPHPDDTGVTGVFARTLDQPEPSDTYPNANLVYRRSALERVGGFDESFWGGGEDTDLAWRVIESGGGVAFAPEAVVQHAVRPATLAQHLRSLPRWATLALVLRRHPQLRRLLHRKVFWKRSHPVALLALVAVALAPFDRRALAAVLPLLVRRTREAGLADGAQLAVADLTEVLVVLAGSARYGAVLL
ncbi:MAG TPA: glycosyltransferase [Acidimicrobiales bacterium]|jgi:GT2 family glycosyltransferase|nr:glycosyltransferase [Acidimicrobiales bacterium]